MLFCEIDANDVDERWVMWALMNIIQRPTEQLLS